MSGQEILTPSQMAACDAYTIAAGTTGYALMQKAGDAVAQIARQMAAPGSRVLVIAGPGNNGGDGYEAAQLLLADGFNVAVLSATNPDDLAGDARRAYTQWTGQTWSRTQENDHQIDSADLVIDALFGAGLTRPLSGEYADLVDRLNRSPSPILSVDLPSGLDGRTGHHDGVAIRADQTITFHRLKPAHVLYPGRELCGRIHLADIGLSPDAIAHAGYCAQLTFAGQARSSPIPAAGHKYHRGHALVLAGPPATAGAGFLAAQAALRAGAGLVTLAAPTATHTGSLGRFPALMRATCDTVAALSALLAHPKRTVCLLGSGLPPDETTRQMTYAALRAECPLVLDAGALTAFSHAPEHLFDPIADRSAPTVLTPHEGEFGRLFPDLSSGRSKLDQTQTAAIRSGAILVHKGADTVIAHPRGTAETTFINGNAPPWLATAGSGDVLAGLLTGRLADPLGHTWDEPSLCARIAGGVWLHGHVASDLGPGMVASDMDHGLHTTIKRLDHQAVLPLPQGSPT